MKKIFLREEQWEEKYKPQQNHISGREEYNGWMFETYGEDDEFIRKFAQENPNRVWTVLTGLPTGDTIIQGFHLVDRYCHFITEVPFSDEEDVEVLTEGSVEYGLTDEDRDRFIEFAKSWEENDEENQIPELIEAYEKAEDKFYPFEELFVYVRQLVDEQDHFDSNWSDFKSDNN